ncbi:hypothetical protein HYQ46_004824 [Verticillium longisporum]|nr:hypothetical protein HYQ46_004824 [Verticillium longisporum]
MRPVLSYTSHPLSILAKRKYLSCISHLCHISSSQATPSLSLGVLRKVECWRTIISVVSSVIILNSTAGVHPKARIA